MRGSGRGFRAGCLYFGGELKHFAYDETWFDASWAGGAGGLFSLIGPDGAGGRSGAGIGHENNLGPVSVLDNNVLFLRPSPVTDDLAGQLFSTSPTTNRIAGTILDLRFVDGDASAVDPAVKLFTARKAPLVILANGETRGGAATLAARLRSMGGGVIIGSTNVPGLVSPDIAVDVATEVERGFLADPYMKMPTTGLPDGYRMICCRS